MRNTPVWLILCSALLAAACGKKDDKPDKPVAPPTVEQKGAGNAPQGGDAPLPEPKEEVLEDPFLSLDAPKDVAEPPPGAKTSKSGLAWTIIKAGNGKKGADKDTVFVQYTSWKPDGKRTSTTRQKDKPKELRIGKAVPGWRESFLDMSEGERRRVWMPSKLAHTRSKRRKGGPRTVDFELVRVVISPQAPADVKKAPKSAEKSATGLQWVVLKPGSGAKPTDDMRVTVKYAGWTTDGDCFDHTPDDETMSFNLSSVIPGWREGMVDMAIGEKRRFWIPKKLAYDGADGKPEGMLVFDIELLEIDKP